MNLEVYKKIKEILQRNILLEDSLKSQILNAKPEQWDYLYQELQLIDDKQTALFAKILIKNPNFFTEIKNKKIHLVLKELLDREARERLQEIALAEKELLAALF